MPDLQLVLRKLTFGLGFIVWILNGADPTAIDWHQEYAGAQALLAGTDPYAGCAQPSERLDPNGTTTHCSAHPPVAYLFGLPFVRLEWIRAAIVWALCMMALLYLSAGALGVHPLAALGLVLLVLLWSPSAYSLGQLTAIWLAGLAFAWRYRSRPMLAGVFIGLASLTKFMPAISILFFLRRRQWRAVAGLAGVWLVSTITVFAMSPSAITGYLAANRIEGLRTIMRVDNGAFLAQAIRLFGWPGLVLAVALIGLVAWSAWRANDQQAFMGFAWLGVAVLPVAWTYSLLPLVLTQFYAITNGRLAAKLLGVSALLVGELAFDPASSPQPVALAILLTGLAQMATVYATRTARSPLRPLPETT